MTTDNDVASWLEEEQAKKEAEAEAARERLREAAERFRSKQPTERTLILREGPGLDTQALIRIVCDEMRDFLVEKNEQYGDSAINPVRIFSTASPEEQLHVRIDDKLSRLARGDDRLEADDDVVDDLIGYLILLKVSRRRNVDS